MLGVSLRDRMYRNEVIRQRTNLVDIAHRINKLIWQWALIVVETGTAPHIGKRKVGRRSSPNLRGLGDDLRKVTCILTVLNLRVLLIEHVILLVFF